jgi:hypothetical protein
MTIEESRKHYTEYLDQKYSKYGKPSDFYSLVELPCRVCGNPAVAVAVANADGSLPEGHSVTLCDKHMDIFVEFIEDQERWEKKTASIFPDSSGLKWVSLEDEEQSFLASFA